MWDGGGLFSQVIIDHQAQGDALATESHEATTKLGAQDSIALLDDMAMEQDIESGYQVDDMDEEENTPTHKGCAPEIPEFATPCVTWGVDPKGHSHRSD